jgi:hypothetical protein
MNTHCAPKKEPHAKDMRRAIRDQFRTIGGDS